MKIAIKTFVALYSYNNVNTKRFRTKYLEQIRTRWFRLFFLVKLRYSYENTKTM